ncbi:MAG TPA: methyltransferase [Mycobacteriales bacterium]|nr:methyltransferase [Mycobacteriales bacterium]
MSLVDPDTLLADGPRLRAALDEAGWSAAALDDLLGATARTHLDRDELAPLLRRTRGSEPLATLARLFVLGVPVEPREAERAGVPQSWLAPDGSAAARLQPVRHGGVEVLCPHDPGRAATGVAPDQVLGVGAASLTLAAATPRDVVGSALDLGAGCGVQALLADDHARRVVATDSNPRATSYARLAGLLNRADVETRTGDLLEPVAGERFDLVVSNPPFVIGPGRRYTYRDSGLGGDEVCRRLVQQVPAHLTDDGVAVLLANWLHLAGEDGDERVRSWFAGTGCDGWVVQRELAAPQDYVTAWLRDTDEGPRFDALYEQWLDALDGVEAVAFGVIAMRPGRERVSLDEVDQPVAATWGEQVRAHFATLDLLEGDLLAARLRLREDVRLHSVARRTDDGWYADAQLLQQEAGLRWSGGVDAYGATLLAGCDGSRRLGDLLAVLASSAGLSEGEAAEQVLPVVGHLVRQGFLLE